MLKCKSEYNSHCHLHGIVIFYWFRNGQTSLQSQNDRHEYGRDYCHTLELVQEVGIGVGLDLLMNGSKVLSDRFEKRADDEDVVKGGQADEHPVEDGVHSLAQEDRHGHKVASHANAANYDLKVLAKGLSEHHCMSNLKEAFVLFTQTHLPREME